MSRREPIRRTPPASEQISSAVWSNSTVLIFLFSSCSSIMMNNAMKIDSFSAFQDRDLDHHDHGLLGCPTKCTFKTL